MAAEIVKVQRPIVTTDPHAVGKVLVYAEGRDRPRQQVPLRAVRRALKGDLKGYFEATWDKANDRWEIGERVDERPW